MTKFCIFIAAFLFSCCHDKYDDYILIIDEITNNYSKQIRKQYGFKSVMIGSNYVNGIHRIGLGYSINKKVNLSEARTILVRLVSKLLNDVNANNEIKPYLNHCPFTVRGVDFDIEFFDSHDKDFTDGSIAYVSVFHVKSIDENIVIYKIFDPIKGEFVKTHMETYEEAEQIVRDDKGL